MTLLSRIKRKTRFIKAQRAERIANFKARVERTYMHDKLFGGAAAVDADPAATAAADGTPVVMGAYAARKRPRSVLGHFELVQASQQKFVAAVDTLRGISAEWSSARTDLAPRAAADLDRDEAEADEALALLFEMLREGRAKEITGAQSAVLANESKLALEKLVSQFSSMSKQTAFRGCGNWLARASRGLSEENKVLEAKLALNAEKDQDLVDVKEAVDAQVLEVEYHEFNALNSFYAGLQQQARVLKQRHQAVLQAREQQQKALQAGAAGAQRRLRGPRRGLELSEDQVRKHELEVNYAVLLSQFEEKHALLEDLQRRKRAASARDKARLLETLLKNVRQASAKRAEKIRALLSDNQRILTDHRAALRHNDAALQDLVGRIEDATQDPNVRALVRRERRRLDDAMLVEAPEAPGVKSPLARAKVKPGQLSGVGDLDDGDGDGDHQNVARSDASRAPAAAPDPAEGGKTRKDAKKRAGRKRAAFERKRELAEALQALRADRDRILAQNARFDLDMAALEKAVKVNLRKSRREQQKEVELKRLEDELQAAAQRAAADGASAADSAMQLQVLERDVETLKDTIRTRAAETHRVESSLARQAAALQEAREKLQLAKQTTLAREGRFDAVMKEQGGLLGEIAGELDHQTGLMSNLLCLKTRLKSKATERKMLHDESRARLEELDAASEHLMLLEEEAAFLGDPKDDDGDRISTQENRTAPRSVEPPSSWRATQVPSGDDDDDGEDKDNDETTVDRGVGIDARVLLSSVCSIQLDFRDLADPDAPGAGLTKDYMALRKDVLLRARIVALCDKVRDAGDAAQTASRDRQQVLLQRLQAQQRTSMEHERNIQSSHADLAAARMSLNELRNRLKEAETRARNASETSEIQRKRIEQEYVGTANSTMLLRAKELLRAENEAQQAAIATRLKTAESLLKTLIMEREHDLLGTSKLHEFAAEALLAAERTGLQAAAAIAKLAAQVALLLRELSPRTSLLRFLGILCEDTIPQILDAYAGARRLEARVQSLAQAVPDLYASAKVETEAAKTALAQAFTENQRISARNKAAWVQLEKETVELFEVYKQPDSNLVLQQRDAFARAQKKFLQTQEQAHTVGLFQAEGPGQATLPTIETIRDTCDKVRDGLETDLKNAVGVVQSRVGPLHDQMKPLLKGIRISTIQCESTTHVSSSLGLQHAMAETQKAQRAMHEFSRKALREQSPNVDVASLEAELTHLEAQIADLRDQLALADAEKGPAHQAGTSAAGDASTSARLRAELENLVLLAKATAERKGVVERAQEAAAAGAEEADPGTGDQAKALVREDLLVARRNQALIALGTTFISDALSSAGPIVEILTAMPHTHFAAFLRTAELKALQAWAHQLRDIELVELHRVLRKVQSSLSALDGLDPRDITLDNLADSRLAPDMLALVASAMHCARAMASIASACAGHRDAFAVDLGLELAFEAAGDPSPPEVDDDAVLANKLTRGASVLDAILALVDRSPQPGAAASRAQRRDERETGTGLRARAQKIALARANLDHLRGKQAAVEAQLRSAAAEEAALAAEAEQRARELDEIEQGDMELLGQLTAAKEQVYEQALRIVRMEADLNRVELARAAEMENQRAPALSIDNVGPEHRAAFMEMASAEKEASALEAEREDLLDRLGQLGLANENDDAERGLSDSFSIKDGDSPRRRRASRLEPHSDGADWNIVHRLQMEMRQELGHGTETPAFGANNEKLALQKLRMVRKFHARASQAIAGLRKKLALRHEVLQAQDPGPKALAEANRLRIENRGLQTELRELTKKSTDSMALAQRAKIAHIEDEQTALQKEIARVELRLGLRTKSKKKKTLKNQRHHGADSRTAAKGPACSLGGDADDDEDDKEEKGDANDDDDDDDDDEDLRDEEERELERKLEQYQKQVRWWQTRWAEHMQEALQTV